MNKKVCDICGKDAALNGKDSSTYNSAEIQTGHDLICDNKARIKLYLSTAFVHHSTGYGGPPDLCPDCFVVCADLLINSIKEQAERLKNDTRT